MFVPALGILFCLGLISAYPANFYLWAVVIYLALLLAITLRVWTAATIDAI